MAQIEVCCVTKTFSRGKIQALSDVSFSCDAGELVCVIGCNGAGKTTLLRSIAGTLLTDSGTIKIAGCDSEKDRRRLGFSLGVGLPGFYDRLTGRQNLQFFANLYGLSSSFISTRLDQLQKDLQLKSLDRFFQQYSDGMQRRLQLARACMHDPPILLLDEPLRGIDISFRDHCLEYLRKLIRDENKTVLVSTHDAEVVRRADRIIALKGGLLEFNGSPDELSKKSEDWQSALKRVISE